jgi:hypothetical protein
MRYPRYSDLLLKSALFIKMPRIGMFVLFGAQWAPGKALWAPTLSPEPISGLGLVGLWALWAGAEV